MREPIIKRKTLASNRWRRKWGPGGAVTAVATIVIVIVSIVVIVVNVVVSGGKRSV